jgi:hypothetical protein
MCLSPTVELAAAPLGGAAASILYFASIQYTNYQKNFPSTFGSGTCSMLAKCLMLALLDVVRSRVNANYFR